MKRAWGLLVLLGSLIAVPAQAQKGLTLQEAERRLIRGGYVETLYGAYWAKEQGEAIIPLLAKMLFKKEEYAKAQGGATGAFPFNALWALAHIHGPTSQDLLAHYYMATNDKTALLAIAGHKLRSAQPGQSCGVLVNEAVLRAGPSEQAKVMKNLSPGQKVKILKEKIDNPREEGPRGGPTLYDQVELIPGGEQGYIPRAGDNFTPFI
jgi:hypothetical protein